MTEIESIARGLNSKQRRLIVDAYGPFDDFGYCSFRDAGRKADLYPDEAATETRALAEIGVTVFGSGLWTDDGKPYGSGYALTPLGLAVRAILKEPSDFGEPCPKCAGTGTVEHDLNEDCDD